MIQGTSQPDTILGTGGNDAIFGLEGSDVLFGLGGNDYLDGGFGLLNDRDKLIGGDGDDTLVGSGKRDGLSGGPGSDLYLLQQFGRIRINELGDPSHEQIDRIHFETIASIGHATFAINGKNLIIGRVEIVDQLRRSLPSQYVERVSFRDGGEFNIFNGRTISERFSGSFLDVDSFIYIGNANAEIVDGSAEGDFLVGLEGNDTLSGADGPDTIYGGEGSDSISGGQGSDYLFGDRVNTGFNLFAEDLIQLTSAGGADFINGGPGDDFIAPGTRRDTVFGGDGDDRIIDGDGNDYIDGGAGDDVMTGGVGFDTLLGGDGDDLIRDVRVEDGNSNPFFLPVILGGITAYGGAGNDTFRIGIGTYFNGTDDPLPVSYMNGEQGGDRYVIYYTGGFTGANQDGFVIEEVGGDAVQIVPDVLFLAGVDSSYIANVTRSGSDLIVFQMGIVIGQFDASRPEMRIEQIKFSDGLKLNLAADGNATAKSDLLFGQAGLLDTFVIKPGSGGDYIQSFDGVGGDQIRLIGFGPALDDFTDVLLAATQVGGNVVIDLGSGDSLTLINTTVVSLQNDDFVFG